MRGSHVEHRFEFRWPLDRQFSRIAATQKFASYDTAQPKQAEQLSPVSQQSSGSLEIRKQRNGWEAVAQRASSASIRTLSAISGDDNITMAPEPCWLALRKLHQNPTVAVP